MLEIYTSNRLETLVSAFGKMVASTLLASPFEREWIVVQSRGMQRWLSMRLASQFGVWAGAEYPFPNALIQRLFEWLELSKQADTERFSKETISWSLMRFLPDLLERDSFAPLRAYLDGDRDGLKLFQLSGRIADTFDQYTLFRPDLLAAWEAGGDDAARDWQPELWRALVAEHSGKHRGQLQSAFLRKVRTTRLPADFPKRISLFGVSYMPPYHIEILQALAVRIPVNLFLLSPTREFWTDIVSRRRLFRMSESERALSVEGNPLLASLGKSGREFAELLLDVGNVEDEYDLYDDPGTATLLRALQSDILNLRGDGTDGRHPMPDASDCSVQVHSCHNPLREVEVLHDNLLDLLDKLPGLEPRDIVVMTPDIETYAPYIATVFGASGPEEPRLPHSIADRRMLDEGGVAPAILKLLELYGSRHTAPALFDLLSSPPVSRHFRLGEEELDTVRRWIKETRIRWGMDEGARSKLGLPPFRENSWRAGLERLLLGYAMPDEGRLFNGVLPFEVAGDAETLGKLADFIDAVDQLSTRFSRSRPLGEWRNHFFWMLENFIEADADSERELAHVKSEIDSLTSLAENSRFEGEVSAQVMIAWLRGRLEQFEMGLGFMTGGITFCAMLPMRSIPFRVVAMIGMNDGAFPRQQRPPGFDLLAREPRKGDRSVRGDDRYLFLESLLSARDVFYLSYVGQSVRENTPLPPSVLVSELLDAIERGFEFPEGEDAASRLVVQHRLQGFSPAYFTKGSSLFSYSADNFKALAGRNSLAERPFIEEPLNGFTDEDRTVTLDDLARFFANPAAYFLERRLGLKPSAAVEPLEEREPFEVAGLERYAMRQELLEAVLEGHDGCAMLPLFRSRGLLPPATHGELLFRKLLVEVEEFATKVQELKGGGTFSQLDIDLDIGGFRLTGKLDHLLPTGQLLYRCARMRAQDRLRAWLLHLAYHAVENGATQETCIITLDRSIRYRPVDDTTKRLETLLDLYREGITEPLPFFPRTSLAWAEKAEKPEADRRKAALGQWLDGFGGIEGEGNDPAIRRCFGQEPPFGDRFKSIADKLLLPMIEHEGKV
ncbi:MAG TPA: exodeoxyribonuclease V subunit gamma [Chlorobaculum sp.]|uniref:RecBCD enzyme subunit RecC n=1 Tax=Chlorobaculum tepidum (strain ATCC 49652 / DSM 12025 / NBRC 103806 / TLS) TaxID=194439 RepID=Q8KDI2_CHLTE|nr:exodeoxyribonuclease V subunit gamma [Chlorobaculum tepidum]AAM72301.1 exodeoxyribonuclease V, gamma subunit [Chlorobaculum tepidum TLS]HBU22745.1 exodeoxyribonuclease V subunit gamma [Chlorobaculum sp.]